MNQFAFKHSAQSFELSLSMGLVAQIGAWPQFPFPRTDLSYGLSDRYTKRGVAVQDSDADLQFGDLAIEVAGHEGLAE